MLNLRPARRREATMRALVHAGRLHVPARRAFLQCRRLAFPLLALAALVLRAAVKRFVVDVLGPPEILRRVGVVQDCWRPGCREWRPAPSSFLRRSCRSAQCLEDAVELTIHPDQDW